MSNSMLKVANDCIGPLIRKNAMIANMTLEEKSEYIKQKYGLKHGKGKRKRKKR